MTETRELLVERVGAQGDGVADGEVFVAGALPGERILARVEGLRASLEQVLESSPERVRPPCPHFGACGGCALQHWAHAPYIAWKAEQIRLALARVRIETDIRPAFASPAGSRRRLALHARKVASGRAEVGFKARRTWRVVPLTVCPVAVPALQAALPTLRAVAAPLFEHEKSTPILHATLTETGIDVEITGVERRRGPLSADARALVARAAAAGDLARVTLDEEILFQARAPILRLGRAEVRPPPGFFLQAVAEAEAAMAAFAHEALAGARRVADLYAGVGTFALRLAETASVAAFDMSAASLSALAAARGTAPGLKQISIEARDLERRPVLASEVSKFDAAVIDPPRAGAPAQHAELARSQLQRIVGVSCNPATFARDARVLTDGGFRLLRVLPVDQFVWSPHVELIGLFERRGS